MIDAVESIKHDPEEFGGFQTEVLTPEEAQERYCARRFCANRGEVQISIPDPSDSETYRVLCAQHFIMSIVVQSAILGDPAPFGEGKQLCEKFGLDFDSILLAQVPTIVDLRRAVCDRCGGGMMVETVGMYKGRRFVHTCPEADNDPRRFE